MKASRDVTVPDIGDFDGVEIVEVLVAVGDRVEADQSLVTLESDKASMEVPAPVGGLVTALPVKVGDQVSEGSVIATLDVAADAVDNEHPSPPAFEPEAPSQAAPPRDYPAGEPVAPHDPESIPWASPAVRRRARELGVDLATVRGSGRNGRITPEDVDAAAAAPGAAAAPAAAGQATLPPMPEIDFSQFGEIEIEPLSRINRLTGRNLHRSWLHVPHVTQFDAADISELEAFRKASQARAEAAGVKLTFVSFLLAACAAALREFPRFNASLSSDGESLVLKRYVNIGVAVDTPKGLVVPVIRDVDGKRLFELAAELGEVSARARDGKLTPADIQGGTFTISSLGGIGGTAFTPIVNAPEVAILGVSRSRMEPVWNGDAFEPRLMLPLSLSYDHRVIDGAAAVRFTSRLGELLGDIRNLLL